MSLSSVDSIIRTNDLQTEHLTDKQNITNRLEKQASLPNVNQELNSRTISINKSFYVKEEIELNDKHSDVIVDIDEASSFFKLENNLLDVFIKNSIETNFLYFQSKNFNILQTIEKIMKHKNKFIILSTIIFFIALIISNKLPFLEVCQFSILFVLLFIFIADKIEKIVNNKIEYQYDYQKIEYAIRKNLHKHRDYLLQNGIDNTNINFFYDNLKRNKLDNIFMNERLNIANKNIIIQGYNDLKNNNINISRLTKSNHEFLLNQLNILSGLFIKNMNQYNMILKKRLLCLKDEIINFMIKSDSRDCIHDILLINEKKQDNQDMINFFIPFMLAYISKHV